MGKRINPIKNEQFRGKKKIFGIEFETLSKEDILEKIKKFIKNPRGMLHIVSLNPEILVISLRDKEFKEIIRKAQIKIVDGVGVVLALFLLGQGRVKRMPGVDLFKFLLDWAGEKGFKVLLIGGKGKLAKSIADCYKKRFSSAKFLGIEGIENIRRVKKNEEKEIFSIVADFKPHFIFVAFGSPFQEKWIWRNRKHFEGAVVMGVGGAFDYVGGLLWRPPLFIRKIGLEWFWRLILQPWRAKRQVRLLKFSILVLKDICRNIAKIKL